MYESDKFQNINWNCRVTQITILILFLSFRVCDTMLLSNLALCLVLCKTYKCQSCWWYLVAWHEKYATNGEFTQKLISIHPSGEQCMNKQFQSIPGTSMENVTSATSMLVSNFLDLGKLLAMNINMLLTSFFVWF